MLEGDEEEPSTTVIFGFEARRLADGDEASRVSARMWKSGGEIPESAAMRLPPCLPVAPTTRSFRVAILGVLEGKMRVCSWRDLRVSTLRFSELCLEENEDLESVLVFL